MVEQPASIFTQSMFETPGNARFQILTDFVVLLWDFYYGDFLGVN